VVILITQNDDLNTRLLEQEYTRRRIPVRRLTFGLAAHSYRVEGSLADPLLSSPEGTFSTQDFIDEPAILMRVGLNPQDYATEVSMEFARREWNALLGGFLATWERRSPHPWLLGNRAAALKDSKVALFQLASDLGAPLPPTTIHTEFATGSITDDRWVMKGINAWEEIVDGVYFNTRLLQSDDAAHLELPAKLQGPMALQKYLPHSRELRVYLSGHVSFAVQIDSSNREIIDFRLLDGRWASAKVTDVPSDLEVHLRAIVGALELNYCVFDVILDAEGATWLVDINPLGVWDYLENDFGLSLTGKIVDGAIAL